MLRSSTRTSLAAPAGSNDRSLARSLPAWPLTIAFVGYPIWWVLGFSWIVWSVSAFLCVLFLLTAKHIRWPPGFWVFGLAIAGVLVSASGLHGHTEIKSYLYLSQGYFAGAIVCVYTYNLASASRVAMCCCAALCVFTLLVGFVSVLDPTFTFTTLGARIIHSNAISTLTHLQLAQVQYAGATPRPSGPFTNTDQWGAVVGITLPATALLVFLPWRRKWALMVILVAVLGAVAIAYNQDRTLWAVMGACLLYATFRMASNGNLGAVFALVLGVCVVGLLIFATHLDGVIAAKLAGTSSGATRSYIRSATIAAFQRSPWIGYGASSVSVYIGQQIAPVFIGTQGQFWALLYDTGLAGTLPFYAWFFWVLFASRHASSSTAAALRLGIVGGLAMSYLYSLAPDGVVVLMTLSGGLMYEATTSPLRDDMVRAAPAPPSPLTVPV